MYVGRDDVYLWKQVQAIVSSNQAKYAMPYMASRALVQQQLFTSRERDGFANRYN